MIGSNVVDLMGIMKFLFWMVYFIFYCFGIGVGFVKG